MTSLATGTVPVRNDSHSYPYKHFTTSAPLKTKEPILSGSAICNFSLAMVTAKDAMNCL